MAVTLQELSDFNRFAEQMLSNGRAETLQEILDAWEEACAHAASVTALRESMRQHELGGSLPVDEAFAEIRRMLRERK